MEGPLDAFLAITSTIPDENDVEGLHRIRIATKRLRYALQLAKKPLAPASTRVLVLLGTMQDQLGDIHNDDVLIALLCQELHALVDDSIASAISHGTTQSPNAIAAVQDLLRPLASTTRKRHERFIAFMRWWGALRDSGLPDDLQALGSRNRKAYRD